MSITVEKQTLLASYWIHLGEGTGGEGERAHFLCVNQASLSNFLKTYNAEELQKNLTLTFTKPFPLLLKRHQDLLLVVRVYIIKLH